jgi:hypothetical protein
MGKTVGMDGISPLVTDIEQAVADLGMSVEWSGRQKEIPKVDGELRSGATGFVPEFLDETPYSGFRYGAYRYYSAVTHGTQYGLMAAYRDVGQVIEGEPVYERAIDQRHLTGAAGMCATAFAAVLRRAVTVMGWGRIGVEMYQLRTHKLLVSLQDD